MHLTLHPPFLPLLSMLLPLGVQILLHIRKSLHLTINALPFPEATVRDLLVVLEEAEFAVQGALVREVDGELGVGLAWLTCFSRMVGNLMLVGFLLMAGLGVNSQWGREVWRSWVRASLWKVACVWVSLGVVGGSGWLTASFCFCWMLLRSGPCWVT